MLSSSWSRPVSVARRRFGLILSSTITLPSPFSSSFSSLSRASSTAAFLSTIVAIPSSFTTTHPPQGPHLHHRIQHQQQRAFAVHTIKSNPVLMKRQEQAKKELGILAAAFDRYDTHGHGALSLTELRLAMQDLNLPHGDPHVKDLFETLDAHQHGAIDLADWLDHLPQNVKQKILERATKDGNYVKNKLAEIKIQYTHTDEAPMLATYSLLPVFRAFCRHGGVKIMRKDISLAGRIIAAFPDFLTPTQRQENELHELGELAKTPQANIIKLPNVSASIPQLVQAIAELNEKGYAVPPYPAHPHNEQEQDILERYKKILGSAVNPVLREGNSDRRCARPVKEFALAHPPRNAEWSHESKTTVATMSDNDFYSNEKAFMIGDDSDTVQIVLQPKDDPTAQPIVLKNQVKLLPREVIDGTFMSVKALRRFYEKEIHSTQPGTLFSLHLKATMMKVSDPIMFGHCVEIFYQDVFEKYAKLFDDLKVNSRNGLGDVYAKIKGHPQQAQIEADIIKVYEKRPQLAYVNSAKGITNLHVPSDVIVDASMAAAIRDSGRMWDINDKLVDSKFTIPDRCYSGVYSAIIKDCIQHGKLDAGKIGHTSNVGLMAQKAQEYGSHDKTFEIPQDGTVKVVLGSTGKTVFEHNVEKGDIWRMCQTKDNPIQDWVKLAVTRARADNCPAVFWLDPNRAHDRILIQKVEEALKTHDIADLKILIKSPVEAMEYTLARARQGKDTISVTGNVLRDYLTDLFPILELGTSAKMMSIVPLLAGGGMFETGAGGSAPKHVQQFLKEGHLRWDSLGEFLAMAVSLEDLADKTDNPDALVLSKTLMEACGVLLNEGKSPQRKVMTLDNRGSHFYLALYWAEALAKQTQSEHLRQRFRAVAIQLRANEAKILGELLGAEARATDIGGYWLPDPFLVSQAMRPSATFNTIIDALLAASGF